MSLLRPTVAVVLASLASVAAAQQPGWSRDFAPRGLTDAPSDLLIFDDGSGPALHAAGRLTAAGELKDVVVAAWNGTQWRSVAASADPYPFQSLVSAHVARLESFDSGAGPELYAGGYFSTIDGVAVRSVARRTPQGWVPLGANTSTLFPLSVSALRTLSYGGATALYVGHEGGQPTGAPVGSLSKWDGTQWLGVAAPIDGYVLDVAAFDDGAGERLFVAGQLLTHSTPTNFSAVLAWDGATWSTVGGAIEGVVRRLLVFDDGSGPALYAAGISTPPLRGVARWRNGAWEQIGATNVGEVFDLTVMSTPAGPRLVATGEFPSLGAATSHGLAWWDGVQWNNIGFPGLIGTQGAQAICATNGDLGAGPKLFFGGNFLRADLVSARNIASWDGIRFQSLGRGAGLDAPAAAMSRFNGELYVGGGFLDAPGSSQSYLAKWTGVEWSSDTPAVNARVDVLGVADVGAGERLHVVGAFSQPHAQHFLWDGAQSTALANVSGGAEDIRTQLTHDDGSGPALYIGGKFTSVGGVNARNIARWDGQSWSALGPQAPDNTVHALVFHDDGQGGGEQLYAGGAFIHAGGQTVFGVARYDGASWQPVGSGFNSSVFALAVHDDGSGPKLYAGGSFGSAPPLSTPGVARWDGTSWQPVGAGLNLTVNALAVFDDGSGPMLIAGGAFSSSGPNPAARLARWDGSSWSEFGGGADGIVQRLAALDDGTGLGSALWVGGSFRSLGGVVSLNVGRWGRTCESESYCSSGVTSSGCAPALGAIGRASASQATSLVLNATSLEGARSGHLFYGVNGAIASPWGQSSHFLCVKAPTQRTPTQATGGTSGACDGAMTLDWNAFSNANPGALGQPFSAGQDVWAQAFFRDPPGPKTTALSSALRFTICP